MADYKSQKADYRLHRKYTPGSVSWNFRAAQSKLTRVSKQDGNLIVVCDDINHSVRFVIPIGPSSLFARDVLPRLAFDARPSCTFDVNADYMFTWRPKVYFDGQPYLEKGSKLTTEGTLGC